MATRNGRDVVEVVDEIMMGKISAPPAVRLDAAKWIAERIWGKAPDIVAHVDATGGNAFLERMSASELRAFYEGVTAIRTIASAPASTQIPAALATVTAAPAPASAPKPSDSDAPASEDT